MPRVVRVNALSGYRLHVQFDDGVTGDIDLAQRLFGPVFEPLRDENRFKQFRLEGHTLSWDTGADFAPEYLHSLIHAQTSAT